MGQASRANEDLTLADFNHLPAFTLGLEMQLHLPFDLIKKLIARLDVKIQARIWPAQDHDQEIFMMDEEAIGLERRVEEVLILIDPAL
jgi:hypothetical protein